MRHIQNQARAVKLMLGEQQPKVGRYRKSLYNYIFPYHEKTVLFNTFTRAIYELSTEEKELFCKEELLYDPKMNGAEQLEEMIRARLFVPETVDEAVSYLGLSELLATSEKQDTIDDYTILTTTGCNARCFYCFEADFTPCAMRTDTARALADYIASHLSGDRVVLHWFGGEPLCNTTAMDVISSRLNELNIKFSASMTTNGFAFDDKKVESAVSLWNVRTVQITLDGMDEEHNRRKNYYATDCNPFRKTIENIHKLLDKEVIVSVRLNFDHENVKDIDTLCEFLAEEFKGEKRIAVYPAMLFENCGAWNPGRLADEQLRLVEELIRLRDKLYQLKLFAPPALQPQVKFKKCGSNKATHRTVNPDGSFSVCHNYSDTCTYGSIFDGITDEALFRSWMDNTAVSQRCKECRWLPECTAFQKCPIRRSSCVEEMEDMVRRQLTAIEDKIKD